MTRLLFWTVFAAVAVLAFIPSYASLPDAVSISDVLNHSAAFSTLYLLNALAYPAISALQRGGFLLLYGILIEAVQHFLPAREASLGDIAVDAAAITALFCLEHLYRRLKTVAA